MTCSGISHVAVDRGLAGYLFFFFQAEDGIRDRDVTGVQTCALPISATLAFVRKRRRTHLMGVGFKGVLLFQH